MLISRVVVLLWSFLSPTCLETAFDTNRFNSLVAKLKEDAFELAQEVENQYTRRCDPDTMNSCHGANSRQSYGVKNFG